MQSPLLAHDRDPLPDDVRSSNPTWTQSGHDPYYSNQDIAVLHSIVSAAQDQLDHAPDPKPLPAAVLFKAYDDILPTFGIDPDSDHHLSAFVFRIGGEPVHGTLSDKFQAILGRMGILLEFGDNTTVSVRTSSSLSLSPIQSLSSRPNFNHDQHSSDSNASGQARPPLTDKSADVKETPAPHLEGLVSPHPGVAKEEPRIDVLEMPRWARKSYVHGTSQSSAKSDGDEEDGNDLAPSGRRAALVSALDRWRSVAAPRTQQGSHHRGHISDATAPDRRHAVGAGTSKQDGRSSHYHDDANNVPEVAAPADHGYSDTSLNAISGNDANGPSSFAENTLRHPLSVDEAATLQVQRGRLLHRAVRAREIYLASKVFNRWAQRTAARLEREAVARRHMIRFRCFRGWSLVPSSKLPAIDTLRVTTAVQKLQRAVAYQEEQLSSAASVIAEAHRLKVAQRAFERWTCQSMEQASHRKRVQRIRLGTAKRWMLNACQGVALRQVAVAHSTRCSEANASMRWLYQAREGGSRSAAARKAGTNRLAFAYLGEWWGQVEIKRRSQACRWYLLMEQASMAFKHWNLRARVQAFHWRCEYLSVTKVLDKWLHRTKQDNESSSAARHHYEMTAKTRACNHLRHVDRELTVLSHLQGRARLYIRSTRLLKLFDSTVEQRQVRMRSIVRRYLMMRYTQVSSKRRKRNFYAALDCWKAATVEAQAQARVASDAKVANDGARRQAALTDWGRQVVEERQLQVEAKSFYRQAWLGSWRTYSANQGYSEDQAWHLWGSQRQRHCLKAWSIATLQRSGQAHTAMMVQQRHGRETKSRVLQRWKQLLDDAEKGTLETDSRFVIGSDLHHRSSWRSLPARLSFMRQSFYDPEYPPGTMDTPTRWTGLPVPMANTVSSRLMAPVREADDESAATSSAAGDVQAWEPRYPPEPTGSTFVAPLPSTTPQGPVPAHLNPKPRVPYVKAGHLGRSAIVRSVRVRPSPRHNITNRPPVESAHGASRSRRNLDFASSTQFGAASDRISGLEPRGLHQIAPSASLVSIGGGGSAGMASQAMTSRQASSNREGGLLSKVPQHPRSNARRPAPALNAGLGGR